LTLYILFRRGHAHVPGADVRWSNGTAVSHPLLQHTKRESNWRRLEILFGISKDLQRPLSRAPEHPLFLFGPCTGTDSCLNFVFGPVASGDQSRGERGGIPQAIVLVAGTIQTPDPGLPFRSQICRAWHYSFSLFVLFPLSTSHSPSLFFTPAHSHSYHSHCEKSISAHPSFSTASLSTLSSLATTLLITSQIPRGHSMTVRLYQP
jgi:hypothetical protein